MNKKSLSSKTAKPAQKAMPLAVHAATLALHDDGAGAASSAAAHDPAQAHSEAPGDAPGNAPSSAPVASEGARDDGALGAAPVAAAAADTPAPAPAPKAASAGRASKSNKANKADKPGKPVKFTLTLPADELPQFEALRQAHQRDGAKLKKSVLMRAALLLLAQTDSARVAEIVAGLDVPKTVASKARKSKKK